MKVTLARLTLAAWTAWLLALGIMVCLSCRRILHPSFLYMAVPLAVQVICTIAVLGGGIWRTIRGPRRWNAVAWMLFAVLPTLWMAAYVEYLFVFLAGRNHPPNVLTRWAEPMASLIAEPYIRVRYPYQYEGERFLMWSDSPEYDEEQMAAMDAHIHAMEQALGRRSDYKVYWVRGNVFGIGGHGGAGWALGSRSSTHDPGTELNSLDRHEVAHFVLDAFCPSGSEVPMLFHEGWAELHSSSKPWSHWQDCWFNQQEGELASLRMLTGPECYFNSAGPMYWQGSVLVEYILKRFGHEKFAELCCTCREATFSADVERMLGLSVDELDSAYQQDLASRRLPTKRRLLAAKLADGIDADRWRHFVDDACAGMECLRAAFRQSNVTMVETHDNTDENGQTNTHQNRYEYHFDDQRYAHTDCFPEYSQARVVTPEVHFYLRKKHDEKSWRLTGYSPRSRWSELDMATTRTRPADPEFLLGPVGTLLLGPGGPGLTITGLRADDPDSPFVRVSLDAISEGNGKWGRCHEWLDLDPQCDYGLVEARCGGFDENDHPTFSAHVTVQYETIDGRHVPKKACSEVLGAKGELYHSTMEIETCQFGPPPVEVFELANYGDFPPPKPESESFSRVHVLAWIASGFTVLTLLVGSCLAIGSLRRR